MSRLRRIFPAEINYRVQELVKHTFCVNKNIIARSTLCISHMREDPYRILWFFFHRCVSHQVSLRSNNCRLDASIDAFIIACFLYAAGDSVDITSGTFSNFFPSDELFGSVEKKWLQSYVISCVCTLTRYSSRRQNCIILSLSIFRIASSTSKHPFLRKFYII